MQIISEKLFELKDDEYSAFTAKLIPTVKRDCIIGVRTPILRKLATWVWENGYAEEFLLETPHKFLEENHLHAFMLEKINDYNRCLIMVNDFLPYVDNWATCDQLRPKAFGKKPQLIENIKEWLGSDRPYTVRFGLGMLMSHFLGDNFQKEYLELAVIDSNEYYLHMMVAWFFATALCKQYEATLPYIEQKRLPKHTHNKAIQKAIESYRITDEQKEILKTYKIK